MMDMQDMEREIERTLAVDENQPAPRTNGAVKQAMPIDRLESEIRDVLGLRAQLKERCRTCAALILEIERAL
jgi:hypothetical protein